MKVICLLILLTITTSSLFNTHSPVDRDLEIYCLDQAYIKLNEMCPPNTCEDSVFDSLLNLYRIDCEERSKNIVDTNDLFGDADSDFDEERRESRCKIHSLDRQDEAVELLGHNDVDFVYTYFRNHCDEANTPRNKNFYICLIESRKKVIESCEDCGFDEAERRLAAYREVCEQLIFLF
jgi:hypothetical protein